MELRLQDECSIPGQSRVSQPAIDPSTVDESNDEVDRSLARRGREGREINRTLPMTISMRFLVGIYGIVPLCLLTVLLDRLLLGGYVLQVLPHRPENFFLFQLLFGTPHIIASSVIVVSNGDYFRTYRVRLTLLTVFILFFFGAGSLLFSKNVFLAVVGAVTILHVIKQQIGIGKGVCRVGGIVYDAWGWSLITYGSLLYYLIFTEHDSSPVITASILGALSVLSLLVFLLTVACHVRTATVQGRIYLWANAFMVLLSGCFHAQGYSFLAILGPRLVHDLTAFTFYMTHDVNRHSIEPGNLIYRFASRLGIGIFWVCPALAILLTYMIGRYADPLADLIVVPLLGRDLPYAASFMIVGYLGLLHYFTEAFTWREDSDYRRYIKLTS